MVQLGQGGGGPGQLPGCAPAQVDQPGGHQVALTPLHGAELAPTSSLSNPTCPHLPDLSARLQWQIFLHWEIRGISPAPPQLHS